MRLPHRDLETDPGNVLFCAVSPRRRTMDGAQVYMGTTRYVDVLYEIYAYSYGSHQGFATLNAPTPGAYIARDRRRVTGA